MRKEFQEAIDGNSEWRSYLDHIVIVAHTTIRASSVTDGFGRPIRVASPRSTPLAMLFCGAMGEEVWQQDLWQDRQRNVKSL